ncbi:MAG: hypothetical protein IKU32_02880 [Clostridia bacterium]|nr:hypothetical protein [Clostridia bacterium]
MATETPVREKERILTEEEAAERAARKEAAREARRKKKRRKKIIKTTVLVVLAVILVIAAALAGFMLYLQKCGGQYDNITECVQSQPMDAATRYSFTSDGANHSVSMKLDKNDIWWLLYQTGAIAELEKLDTTLAAANARLSGMGISTETEGALTADLEFSVLGNLKIPLRAVCDISADASDVTLSVKDLKLGNGWSLPLRWICARFDADPSALAVKVSKSIHPYLENLQDVSVTGGNVVVTYGAGSAMFAEANTAENKAAVEEYAKYGIETAALQSVVHASGSLTTAFDEAFNAFAADPNAYVDFRTSALALASESAANEYMSGAFAPYAQRFLPNLTIENINALRQQFADLSSNRAQLLSVLATNLNTAYTKGTIVEPSALANDDDDKKKKDDDKKEEATETAPSANFVNTAVEGNPALTMEQMAAGNWASYSEWIAETDMRVVYLTSFPNVSVETQVESDGKKKDKEETPATVMTPAKPIGLLVRMKDGSFRLFYHTAELAPGSTTQVAYTQAYIDLDSATGEDYMGLSFIPSVTYVAPAAGQTTEAPAAEAPAGTEVPAELPAEAETAA